MASTRFGRARRGSAFVACMLGALFVIWGLHPLQAQGGDSVDADTKAMQSYRLTDAGFAKYVQATRNMVQVAKQHPEIASDEKDTDPKSLADMAAVYDRHPQLKHAITSAGMSSREFVLFSLSLFQAGMAAGIAAQNGGKVPEGISPANVEFYKKHAAEMQRLGEEIRKETGDTTSNGGGAAADTSAVGAFMVG
jgi:hypothetical protein